MDTLNRLPETCSIRYISGKEAVLRALPELESAASAWGQQALVRELPFYLSVRGRLPVLLLFSASQTLQTGLQGAVLLYAYGHAIFGRRLLSNADRFGRIGVFGPGAQRTKVAVAATQFLLRSGAVLVRLSFSCEPVPLPESTAEQATLVLQQNRPGELWKMRSQSLFVHLTLHRDLDSTLAPLGRRTRRNMREVMRRCVADLRCSFILDVAMTLEEFLERNRQSGHAVSSRAARWRYTQSRAPAAFLCGVQAADGRWLGLAGGRVSGDTVIVDWQMNDLTFARYSPSLLLRGFLMQHFGERGMRLLMFSGGTAHHMAGHFNRQTVHFLEARRKTIWLNVLGKCVKRCFPSKAATKVLFGHG